MKTHHLFLHLSLLFSGHSLFAQNVGIGTATPTRARLQIVGAANQSFFNASSGDNTTGISVSSPLGLAAVINFNLYYANAYRYLATGYGANLAFNPASGVLSYSTTQTLGDPGATAFFNTANFNLDSNGYLGLGTSVPKARLHALNAVIGASSITPSTGYILSVGGKIISEEVKVMLNSAWPDYVFEHNYDLLPLDQLKQKVMIEKHLPGIPSAAEIGAQKGFELGDMQKRLLEKVEELYRYVFELKGENNALKEELNTLKRRLQ